MSDKIQKISDDINFQYSKYKQVYAELSDITNDIAKLEEERNKLIEDDGRKFLFKKTAVELRDFLRYIKTHKWMSVEYEGFENNRKDIVEEAMVVAVYCYQPNYLAKVKVIIVLDGYLNKDEFDTFKVKCNISLEYYVENDKNGRNEL